MIKKIVSSFCISILLLSSFSATTLGFADTIEYSENLLPGNATYIGTNAQTASTIPALTDHNVTTFFYSNYYGPASDPNNIEPDKYAFKFNEAVDIRKVALISNQHGCHTFKIQYSDDGSTWSDALASSYGNLNAIRKEYSINDFGKHTYWSVTVLTTSTASSNSGFYEIEMMSSLNTTENFTLIPEKNEVKGNDLINAYVYVNNVTDIYATDFSLSFDSDKLEYLNAQVVDSNKYTLYKELVNPDATRRYITASNSASSGINEETQLICLKFKAKNISGQTEIKLLSAKTANSSGLEADVTSGSAIIKIKAITDVNNTGTFTLADLAIASHLLGSDASNWGEFTPDIDGNNIVDLSDINYVIEKMFE